MIKYYFSLQVKLFNRKITSLGVQPMWTYFLILLFFVIASELVFIKLSYASIVYSFIALQPAFFLADKSRNNFIRACFRSNNYRKIRLLENIILTIPFAIFLAVKNLPAISCLLLITSSIISLINVRQSMSITIPTPFGRRPFEFLTGFRRTFIIYPVAMYILVQAVSSHNINLALALLGLMYCIIYSFYLKSEDTYFVWIYSLTPVNFLRKKIVTAVSQSLVFALPVSLTALYISTGTWYIIPLILFLANLYLVTIILAKYSNYPDQISIPQAILLGISMMFPLLLIFIIPLFYKRALRSLNQVLL